MTLPDVKRLFSAEGASPAQRLWARPAQALQRDRWIVTLVVLLALARIALVFLSWSPAYGWDGDNYLSAARQLVNGTLTDYPIGTLIYPAVVAVLVWLFNSIYAVIVFQWALSILAAVSLYFALKPYTRPGAALTACLVAFDPQLGVLHNLVSTDSLYASLQVLGFSALMMHLPPRPRPRWVASLALGLLLSSAYLIRPVGILAVFPAALVYLLALRSWRHTALLLAGFVAVALLLAGWLLLQTGSFALNERYPLAQVIENTFQAQNPLAYWITPTRVRYFANFFVTSGQYSQGGAFYDIDPPWAFYALPTVPGLHQFLSWFTKAWDTVGSSLWLLFGGAVIALAPRWRWKWPLLFGLVMFVYHAAAVAAFNKVVPRYVTVVSFYRVMLFALLLTLAMEGFRVWQRAGGDSPAESTAAPK